MNDQIENSIQIAQDKDMLRRAIDQIEDDSRGILIVAPGLVDDDGDRCKTSFSHRIFGRKEILIPEIIGLLITTTDALREQMEMSRREADRKARE
jgi:hypothetical protein